MLSLILEGSWKIASHTLDICLVMI